MRPKLDLDWKKTDAEPRPKECDSDEEGDLKLGFRYWDLL